MTTDSSIVEAAPLDVAFARQAAATPEAPALLVGGSTVPYGELWRDSLRIAGALVRRGVGPGDVVGLHLERGRGWVAALVGVHRAGAAVLPLPPSYPLERRQAIAAAAAPVVVLVDDETPLPPELETVSLDLSTLEEGAGADETDEAALEATLPVREAGTGLELEPAFVLSSSGTTGRPKLIVRSHRSFFHRLGWTWRTLPFGEGEVGCQKAHQTTTHAVYELFEPLLRGVPTLLVPDAEVRNLEAFWARVRESGVTRLLLVPSMLRATLESGLPLPPGLEAVILMGEAVSTPLARRAVEAFADDTALYSIYGSTEASSVLAADLRTVPLDGPAPPLGVPLEAGIAVRVLDPDGRPVAPGESGRLNLGGPALFDGYLGDPELTARLLREVGGERLFDTRDDVRLGEDGALDFLGRTDSTVKIRGFRVDLLEVERRLRELEGVSEGVAVAAAAPGGESVLWAYVTPASVDTAEGLARLREVLPDHAVPSLLQALDELPRTPSAKVDRRRLAEGGIEAGGPDGPPRWSDADPSPAERVVAGVWARVLGHDTFALDSSFFEAGGTSLSAFTVVRELRDAFDLDGGGLDVTHLLADPTVAGLARRLAPGDGGVIPDDPAAAGLVVLRTGRSADAPPLFLVSAAGGTLGAYSRLVAALRTPRPVVGLEDPYLWGARDPKGSFDDWVDRFVAGVRHRQPRGPYHLCAYSSAGAFGWEVVRRLEALGERVATLVLIDPMAIDSLDRGRWGWWAARCSYEHPLVRLGARLVGRARAPLVRGVVRLSDDGVPKAGAHPGPGPEEVARMVDGAGEGGGFLRRVASLMELDSGARIPDFETDADGEEAGPVFQRFVEAVRTAHPEVDPARLERIVRQYGVQVQFQRAYPLRPVSADVVLFEPESGYAGLLADLVRPFAGSLRSHRLPVGEPTPRQAELLEAFMGWAPHYWCMRDDTFSQGVAEELDRLLA